MNKKPSKYENIILQIARNFHTAGKKNNRKVDYYTEIEKKLKEKVPPNAKYPSAEQMRSQVSRVISKLSDGTNGKLLCIQGKYYVLNLATYFEEKLTEEYYLFLKEKIVAKRRDILRMTHNTCVVLVEPKNNNEDISEIFSDCLGSNWFASMEGENSLLIMIKCNSESKKVPDEKSKEYVLMKALENAITRIYEDQEKEGRVPLKRKRKRKQKKNNTSNETNTGS